MSGGAAAGREVLVDVDDATATGRLSEIEQRAQAATEGVWALKCPRCGALPGTACYGNGPMPRSLTHPGRTAEIIPADVSWLVREVRRRDREIEALLAARGDTASVSAEQVREAGRRALDAIVALHEDGEGFTGEQSWDIVGRAALGVRP